MADARNHRKHQPGTWDAMPKRDYAEGAIHWHEMSNLEHAFATGNGFALMLAIYKCAQRGQPLPAWAARAFSSGFRRAYDGQVRSWDEVLGLPHPKRRHVAEVAPRRALGLRIYARIQNRKPGEGGIGAKLFDLVAAEFKTSRKHVSNLYYETKAVIERPLVRNPDALIDPEAAAIVDGDLILNMLNDPDPLLDCDDPILR